MQTTEAIERSLRRASASWERHSSLISSEGEPAHVRLYRNDNTEEHVFSAVFGGRYQSADQEAPVYFFMVWTSAAASQPKMNGHGLMPDKDPVLRRTFGKRIKWSDVSARAQKWILFAYTSLHNIDDAIQPELTGIPTK